MTSFVSSAKAAILRWFDTTVDPPAAGAEARVDWLRTLPFLFLHLACLLALWTGVSATALWVCGALYAVRMFAITGFYHRYFSHRSFKTSRSWQFVFALLGASRCSVGRCGGRRTTAGTTAVPTVRTIRIRRRNTDCCGATSVGSRRRSTSRPTSSWCRIWRAIPNCASSIASTRWCRSRSPCCSTWSGRTLAHVAPGLATNGAQLVVWGFVVSTVVLFHATCTINSLAHRFGGRRFATADESRNNAWLAVLTLGEGWHNNHHHYPHSAAQGFRWFEFDPTYYVLRALAALGVIRELRPVPAALRRGERPA
jgi:stearoyl-CoA desaturase (delta-9 desaturase)